MSQRAGKRPLIMSTQQLLCARRCQSRGKGSLPSPLCTPQPASSTPRTGPDLPMRRPHSTSGLPCFPRMPPSPGFLSCSAPRPSSGDGPLQTSYRWSSFSAGTNSPDISTAYNHRHSSHLLHKIGSGDGKRHQVLRL